jgi:hypothetical protein
MAKVNLYVVIKMVMESNSPENFDADVLTYDRTKRTARESLFFTATRDAFGSSVPDNYTLFDPLDDDGKRKPFPLGRFLMWDLPDTTKEFSTVDMSITLFDNDGKSELPRAIRRYKSCGICPSLAERVRKEMEASREEGTFKFAALI